MKYKDIYSALVGGAFFAIPYLGLMVPFAPALAIGVSAFGASELIFSEFKRETLKDTDMPLYKKLQNAKKQNKQILGIIPQIEHEETRTHLHSIHDTVSKIIDTVEHHPKKVTKIHNFFDYYLPVLLKICERYDEIENQKLKSKEGREFISSADKMIEEASDAFQGILSSLYQKDIVDADAEMKVFNSMLKADGILDNDISKIGKGGSHEK